MARKEGHSYWTGLLIAFLYFFFSSEIFKVQVQNLPKYCSIPDLKKYFKRLNLTVCKIKKCPEWSYAFITFYNEEEKQKGMTIIDATPLK
jgi:hypothetical protein